MIFPGLQTLLFYLRTLRQSKLDFKLLVAMKRDYLKHLFWHTCPLPIEMASGLTALAWGCLLLIFATPFQRHTYKYLDVIGPHYLWGLFFLFFGLSQIGRILLHCSRDKLVHQIISAFAAFTWIYIATALYMALPDSTASSVYVVLAVGSLWAFIRSGRSGPP